MDSELKLNFQRRLSQCNKGGLIVIMYDIYFAHTECAMNAFESQDREGFKESIRKAAETLDTLTHALDMQYEISGNLLSIYQYCKRMLFLAMSEGKADRIKEANQLMMRLKASFDEVAKQDESAPLMDNAQAVYVGYTYGRDSLNENMDQSSNRGFLV